MPVRSHSVFSTYLLTVCNSANFFFWGSFPLVLFPWSCADLHKRRKKRLKPKRVVVTASFGLVGLNDIYVCGAVIANGWLAGTSSSYRSLAMERLLDLEIFR